ncbi:MAG: hypothetical protein HRU70_09945 [Phycisphaeraceae bacterium]|nr:MAG: hypothetical protein HRU70_09945 [Phycisphaeraceae bacterium]
MTRSVFCLLAVAGVTSAASAFVPWNNPNGTGTGFDWSNGGSDNGLFGSPVLVGGDTFVFFPSGFRAQSTAGSGASIVGDRLEFELEAHANFQFTQIRVTEYGDYGVIGTGSVQAGGTLFATNLDTAQVVQNDLLTTPGSPITSGIGNWSGTAEVDVTPQSARRLRIVLNNNLFAFSLDGVAWIEKKVFGSAVGIQIIPAPGSAVVLGMLGLTALRRRR